MELSSKLLEQIAYNTRSRIEEHILIVMKKPTHEEHLFQPLQTNNKQFKIAITFLTGYSGIFNITNSNKKFYFEKSIVEEDFIQIKIPEEAYEIESLNNEIKRILNDKEYYTEANYPITIKPIFSTLGSIIKINPKGDAVIGFVFDDSIVSLLGFDQTILYKEYNLSLFDILSSDNIFLECDTAQGSIFKGKRSRVIINFTMDVDPLVRDIIQSRCSAPFSRVTMNSVIEKGSKDPKTEEDTFCRQRLRRRWSKIGFSTSFCEYPLPKYSL